MKRKEFDCVRMKHEAQRELLAALESKTPEQQAAALARRAGRNPIWQGLLNRKRRFAVAAIEDRRQSR